MPVTGTLQSRATVPLRLIRPPVTDQAPQRSPSVAASDRGRTFLGVCFRAFLLHRPTPVRHAVAQVVGFLPRAGPRVTMTVPPPQIPSDRTPSCKFATL